MRFHCRVIAVQGGRVVAQSQPATPVDGTAGGVSFVWPAPVGGNEDGCGAWKQPCAAIQVAINNSIAAGGSAVYVGPGAAATQKAVNFIHFAVYSFI